MGGVEGGSEDDQNTLYEILKELIKKLKIIFKRIASLAYLPLMSAVSLVSESKIHETLRRL